MCAQVNESGRAHALQVTKSMPKMKPGKPDILTIVQNLARWLVGGPVPSFRSALGVPGSPRSFKPKLLQ